MRWFRSNIKRGSRFALLALAVQCALSFGHFHLLAAAEAAPAVRSVTQADSAKALGTAGNQEAAQQRSPANHDSDHKAGDVCAICAVVAMAGTVMFATPPFLLLPQAVEFLYLTTDAEFVHLKSASLAFQPRASPAS